MGVGLQPLEFTECLADSPHFRENLQRHEKELERTSQQIKRLIKEVKDVVQAAKRLGAAQLALASSMEQFEFACIGASMTEDERAIGRSLQHFAHLIRTVEDERERMLGRAHEQIIQPLERFRKEHIGAVKEGKKKFDKKTAKFCQSQERTLSLSTKKPETVFQEADAAMDMAERDFCQASLEYVFQLQAVQERKKFELVETLLGFVFGWWTFHHTAHDVHADAEPLVRDLQLRIQRTRSNFEETSKQTESLMKKMMEVRQMNKEEGISEDPGGVSRAGYLFLMEKKAFGTTWSKQYCTYEKESRLLSLMPYNQINVKTTGPVECVCVCGARASCEAERRFCWEAVPSERERAPLTLQALGERDRAAWLRALDAAPLAPHCLSAPAACKGDGEPACELNEVGFAFVRRIIAILEARGLEEQGLYRVAGVASKVARLVGAAAGGAGGAGELAEPSDCESKTLTSALKSYLRALPEPLLTRRLHDQFLAAAKRERREDRVAALHALLLLLPHDNRRMLRLVLRHLRNVAAKSDKNLMTASNLAVCFGPTLLRPERETVASILELKFCNVLVETLLEHYDAVFDPAPPAPHPAAPPAAAAAAAALPAPAHRPHNGLVSCHCVCFGHESLTVSSPPLHFRDELKKTPRAEIATSAPAPRAPRAAPPPAGVQRATSRIYRRARPPLASRDPAARVVECAPNLSSYCVVTVSPDELRHDHLPVGVRHRRDVSHVRPGGGARRCFQRRVRAAPAVAAAALRAPAARAARARAPRAPRRRRGPLQQQLRVRVQPQRVAAAAALHARAHPLRVPRRERGRAVVRAQPDHHERDALRRARLAARLARRPQRPRARELRGAAAVAARR